MFQVNLGRYKIDVDSETLESLKDPKYAANYLREVEKQITMEEGLQMTENEKVPVNEVMEDEIPPEEIWKSSKKPTKKDFEATQVFLALLKELDNMFKKKSTAKNMLWSKIANKMMGYHLGDNARDKARQKFMNLQHTYMKYKDQVRQTGEGFIKKPPYFTELDNILGDQHKAMPVCTIDSTKESIEKRSVDTQQPSSSKSMVEEEGSNTSSPSTGRKSHIINTPQFKKTVRPKKTVLSAVENIIKEERNARQEQFETIMQTIQTQSNQRHEQIMGIIDIIKKQT